MTECRLVARRDDHTSTLVDVTTAAHPVSFGGGSVVVIAGPCAVEGHGDYLEIADQLKALGTDVLRGGAFKPRTSPYAFAGLEREGLEILAEAGHRTGLPVVTEVMDTRDIDLVASYADILQIGSRNMQNFALLKEAGRISKPVVLKRGMSATIEEWLLAAEYILHAGNPNVILCERGIRTYERATRNTLDIAAIPLIKELAHLPVIVDPSHASGKRSLVRPLARASVAAGADGLMIEVHQNPERALSDGPQSLTPALFADLIDDVRRCEAALGRC
ncbi:MAG: 3-deoxy-7-phosphoheptulonate synthase [Solirubrobacterales bacterium]